MKGMVRKTDELGRLVIPKEIRKQLGIKEKEPVDIYLSGKTLCIESARKCMCCEENKEDLVEYKGTYLCEKCIKGFNEERKW